eukprot:7468307-Pyramimonas_sp.AAC.1
MPWFARERAKAALGLLGSSWRLLKAPLMSPAWCCASKLRAWAARSPPLLASGAARACLR